jgi:hypothetical protein
MEIFESELKKFNKDLYELHNDVSYKNFKKATEEFSEELKDNKSGGFFEKSFSRRSLLIGSAGLLSVSALLAACSSSSSTQSNTMTKTNYPANLTGDLAVVALAASLENLGVFAYNAGIAAAQAGKLGNVPSAVVTFAQTAKAQHMQHAQAWNSVLSAAGKPQVNETEPKLTPIVKSQFAKVTDVTSLAKLALEVEMIAAATYQEAVGVVQSQKGVELAATIEPVEMQHVAILNFVLGSYPVPSAFSSTAQSASLTDLKT